MTVSNEETNLGQQLQRGPGPVLYDAVQLAGRGGGEGGAVQGHLQQQGCTVLYCTVLACTVLYCTDLQQAG